MGSPAAVVVALACLAGCKQLLDLRDPQGHAAPDARGGSDVAPDGTTPFSPLHLPDGAGHAGTAPLALDTTTIDTSAMTVGIALPDGTSFDVVPLSSSGELAVLRVGVLSVASGAIVTVVGTRPLVIVAGEAIDLDGVLDGGARRDVPGPGGAGPDAGAGRGAMGAHADVYRDSGGGGGGHGTAGADGGHGGGPCMPQAVPGLGGAAHGDAAITALVAGSGGGSALASACGSGPAGAGGGAIQLSARDRISIGSAGGINVGGGGGGGSLRVVAGCNVGAGSGGGAGGAIVLQAAHVTVAGVLAANGGGGGAPGSPTGDGEHGLDGALGARPARGGRDGGQFSARGGDGGALATAPGAGGASTSCDGNGGGGGGAVGRIAIAIPPTGSIVATGTVSPAHAPIGY